MAHELTHVVQQRASGAVARRQATVGPAQDAADKQADAIATGEKVRHIPIHAGLTYNIPLGGSAAFLLGGRFVNASQRAYTLRVSDDALGWPSSTTLVVTYGDDKRVRAAALDHSRD